VITALLLCMDFFCPKLDNTHSRRCPTGRMREYIIPQKKLK
jgi:hypothetical protein